MSATSSIRAMFTDDRHEDRLLWWLAVAGAVVSIVLGVAMLAWPRATLYVGAVLFGAWLVVHGVIHIVQAVTATAHDAAIRALDGIVGVLFVVVGVIALRHVLLSLLTIATVIGVTWLIGGIVQLAAALGTRYAGRTRMIVGALGGLTVLGGLAVLFWPKLTLLAMVFFTGIWLVIMGLVQLLLVLSTRPVAATR